MGARSGRARPFVSTVSYATAAIPLSAGAVLDDDVVPLLDELTCSGRGQGDPVLVRLDLLDDTDLHGGGTLACRERGLEQPQGDLDHRLQVCDGDVLGGCVDLGHPV